jgi:hypothetical protein
MQRPILTFLAALLALAAMETGAQSAPTISLRAQASPMPGFPHTGNLAGAGATLNVSLQIHGTEYGGFPLPLTHLDLSLPRGIRWSSTLFPKCHYTPLEPSPFRSQTPCPKRTLGLDTVVRGAVAFGAEVVPELSTIQPFYNLSGGLSFFLIGHEPAAIELFGAGTLAGTSPPRFDFNVPLIETVPHADDMSITQMALDLGSGLKVSGKPRFSLHMPKTCPRGGLVFRVKASFAGPTPETAAAHYRAPCPTDTKRR